MMPLYCKTDEAIFLVAVSQGNRVRFFTQNRSDLPGIHFEVRALTPIQVQLQEEFEKVMPLKKGFSLDVIQEFSESVEDSSVGKKTLYLGKITLPEDLEQTFSLNTLEELFKEMPKNKNRIVYLRLIQTLLGVHKERVYVDLGDEDKKS